MDSVSSNPVLDLRFVDRQGKRILQVCRTVRLESGELIHEWKDVRMETE